MEPEYRYTLDRVLVPDIRLFTGAARYKRVLFCALNPSTATAERNDPTVRRMMGFARRFGGTRMRLVNLYAARATDPRDLWKFDEPVGPMNDYHINREARAADVRIAAWGANPKARDRASKVLDIMRQHGPVYRLGRATKAGHPGHPLYLRKDSPLQRHADAVTLPDECPRCDKRAVHGSTDAVTQRYVHRAWCPDPYCGWSSDGY